MTTLTLVFQNPDTSQAIELMRRTFEEVFLHSVRVEVCYMDRIGEAEQLRADVLVVNRNVSLLALRPHASSFRNVVFMTRSIRKKYLSDILAIPRRHGRAAGQRHAGQRPGDDRDALRAGHRPPEPYPL